MDTSKLEKLLTKNFIEKNGITTNVPYTIEEINPELLLTPDRFDIVAKIAYIDFRERQLDSDFGLKVYKEHIDAFSLGTNSEPGDSEKNTIEDYVVAFDKIIDDVKEHGFDSSKSLVPIGENNIALNGAHRIAACIYFKKPITVIRFRHLTTSYDYKFFLKRGLDKNIADYLATKYCELKPDTFAFCLWPKTHATDNFKAAEKLIEHSKDIGVIYKKRVDLSFNGLRNLLLQVYAHDSWTGDYTNGFKGTDRKVDYLFSKKSSKLQFYILEADSLKKIVDLKQKVRDLYDIGNDSVHSTDNQAQTLQMARLLLNQHSLHHLQNATVSKYKDVHKNIDDFKQALSDQKHNTEDFIVDTSSVLSIYGIRPANDFDYLSHHQIISYNQAIERHDKKHSPHATSVDDLLHNPTNHFYFQDIKFVNLENILKMKTTRSEGRDIKDIKDIKLINPYLNGNKGIDFYIAKLQSRLARHRVKATIFVADRLDRVGLKEPIKRIIKQTRNMRS